MKPIIVEQTFETSVENVWNAITVVEEMTQWFFPNIATFKPVLGFETRFVIQNEDRVFPHLWKVEEVIPMKKISYQWKFEGYPGSAVSAFEIKSKSNVTELKLTFTIIEEFPDHIPEFKRESGVTGWNYFIKESLKEYLESI